jgi:hypothetical protein
VNADDPREVLARRRSDALGAFLEDAILRTQPDEDIELEGPGIITGALLIVRSRDTGAESELTLCVPWPYSLGLSEKLGLLAKQKAVYMDRDGED